MMFGSSMLFGGIMLRVMGFGSSWVRRWWVMKLGCRSWVVGKDCISILERVMNSMSKPVQYCIWCWLGL